VVTPEITSVPRGMGNMAPHLRAKAGGLADVSASLVGALFELDSDVHVALPHYRRMFHIDVGRLLNEELRVYKSKLPSDRIHLAEDRIFYYRNEVYSGYSTDSRKVALAFQREVINNIIPRVYPDLIHCNDWLTGLVPAAARRLGIPALFTVHNIHTNEVTLGEIEDRGIDAAEFWQHLYFKYPPGTYDQTRDSNPVNLLASGIFASHFVNTVSPSFLEEVCHGIHDFVPAAIKQELSNKNEAGCAFGILNAPDPSFRPDTDAYIDRNYSASDHREAKRENKVILQEHLGLDKNPDAPLFFWPSRLDPSQKGCQLLADILYTMVSEYWGEGLQVVIVASGPFQKPFHDIVRYHDIHNRVSVCDFDEKLSHKGYAASDFLLMPSLFEPCGLPQMISCIYGSLPVVNDTGGLHDTVSHMNVEKGTGNGFVFNIYDSSGLKWAVDQAINFYRLPRQIKEEQVSRVMIESAATFTHSVTAQRYFDLYERMLERPLVRP
jgi:ADP-glucose type glycogen/starch synthase